MPGTKRKAWLQFDNNVRFPAREGGGPGHYHEIRANPDGFELLVAPFTVGDFLFFQFGQVDQVPDETHSNVNCRSAALRSPVEGQPSADRYPRGRVGRFTFIGVEPAGPFDRCGAFTVQIEQVCQWLYELGRRTDA